MASIIITLKAVLEAPEVDAESAKEKIVNAIEEYGADIGRTEIEEVAYGIKAVRVMFIVDEEKGSTDALEEKIKGLEGVSSVEIIDVRRAIG